MSMGSWWTFSETMVATEQDEGGTYEFGNSAKVVVYVGSSSVVRTRLYQHLNTTDPCIAQHAKYYRVDYRSDYQQEERRRYHAHALARGVPPQCNDVRP